MGQYLVIDNLGIQFISLLQVASKKFLNRL
jgi:hypothetical protein